jgi:hypothetical protein
VPVSDRDRKILWAKAGNSCSNCHAQLVQPGAAVGSHALVGEECHIVSPRVDGPRGVTTPGAHPELDAYSNLILLCAACHTRIDQLPDEYPPARLIAMRNQHEAWVRARLGSGDHAAPVTVRRGDRPMLVEVTTGREAIGIVAGSEESSLDHEDVATGEEADLVGGFLQQVFDWSEIWDEIEPAGRVSAHYALDQALQQLHRSGWRVFGGSSRGHLTGGVTGPATPWITAYLHVVRSDSPQIVSGRGHNGNDSRLGTDGDGSPSP